MNSNECDDTTCSKVLLELAVELESIKTQQSSLRA
jgi:hypothetical protein